MVTDRFLGITRLIAVFSIALLFVGCGGGGGGGGSDKSGSQATVDISGRVLDSSATPIPGATVTFASNPVVVTTDNSGNFSAKIAPGKHTITISMGNVTFYQNTFTANEGLPVSLGDLAPTTPYYTYNISGTVTVSGGGALPSVIMTLSGAGSGTTTTDTSGNYSFTGLANGSYTVTPSLAGRTFTPTSQVIPISGANATKINFAASTPPAPPLTPLTPSISTQGSLDFGVALIGGSSSRQLLISNTGSGTLNIGQLSLPTGSSFHITKDCSGTSIPSGGTSSVTLSLTPNSQTYFSDTLTIPSNDSTKNPLTVTLTGKGRALNASINGVTTDGNVVKLLVSVSNIARDPVVGLKETCFTVKENGIQQTISNFTHPITTPISIDLVFDCSGSLSISAQSDIQNAANSFVSRLVNGVDETGVIKFTYTIGAKTDFTTDKSAVIAAINAPYPLGSGGTALYDSLITAIDDTALRTNIRRAIIVFSDGNDESSINNTLTAVIDRAILKDVPIFAIAYTNATNPKPEVMQQLAQETGGEFYLTPSSSEVAGIYDKISQILSQQYLIEYVSSSTGGATIFLDVIVNNNGDLGEALKKATGCY